MTQSPNPKADDLRALSAADENALPQGQSSTEGAHLEAVRDHVRLAKARIETALGFVMFPEVREELRKARSHLALTLSFIGE